MARLHSVKKARKANKTAGIKKGDSYFWWKFRFGGKHFSKTRPRRSQLTQSAFYAAMYDIEDDYAEICTDYPSDAESEVESIKDRVQEQIDELQEKQQNLDSAFPNGCPSLDTINERIDALETCVSDLDDITGTLGGIEEVETDSEDFEDMRSQIEDALGSMGWDYP